MGQGERGDGRHDDGPTDSELVARAATDPDAFAILFRRYLPRIRAFAIRRCGDQFLADDIAASVFERAWRSLSTVEVREHGIAPWLYRIASNELASHFRKTGRGQRAQERLERVPAIVADDPADAVILQSDTEALREALGTLNPRHQEVIALRYLAGLSASEAAEAMGIPPPTLAAVLHRALKALESAMREHTKGR